MSIEPRRLRAKKKKISSVAVPPAPVRVPSQRPLDTSVTSVVNGKGDNKMIPGAVHRSSGTCLKAEEIPGNPSVRRPSDEGAMRPVHLKWGPFPPNKVGKIAQHVRKGVGRKK